MKTVRAALVRFAGLFRRKRLEAEMNEEMRAHLDGLIERNLAKGMSPDEARYAALRTFGGVAQIAECARDVRRSAWGEQVLQDLRYAVRHLRKAPGFAAVVALSLALGIGASTTIFSFINSALLKPLPVRDPHELVLFEWVRGAQGGAPISGSWGDVGSSDLDPVTGRRGDRMFSLRAFERFREETATLTDVFAVAPFWGATVRVDDQVDRVQSNQLVSGNYFQALGVTVLLGRTLGPEDDRAGATPVAVISHRFWQTRLGGRPTVLGTIIFVNRIGVTIVGVTAPGFDGTLLSAGPIQLTLPLVLAPRLHQVGAKATRLQDGWLRIMGRLRPSTSAEQAAARLEPILHSLAREALPKEPDVPRLRATPGAWGRGETDRRNEAEQLSLLMGLAVLLLVAACANVANLQLARGAARRREIVVRLALGAGRGRIVRQLLVESLLLALLGAALGVLCAVWGGGLLFSGERPEVDGTVLGFAWVVAGLVAVGFGLAPALRGTRVDLAEEFQGSPRVLGGHRRSRLGQGLMLVQVAISLVLLVGAGLFVRTVKNLQALDVGFNRTHLLRFSIDAGAGGYARAQWAAVHARIAGRIGAVAGVRAVTYSGWAVLDNSSGFQDRFSIPGRTLAPGQEHVKWDRVGENYFETIELPLRSGRSLGGPDFAPAARVVVVNQAFVRAYFPDGGALGQRIRIQGAEREIVGVTGDMRPFDLRQDTPPMVWLPFAHSVTGDAEYIVRTFGEPAVVAAAVRAAVAEIERDLPLAEMHTQDERVESLLSTERLFARLAGFFGCVALVLACIGLYGFVSYAVHRRTGEIGLRMALGALPAQILRMILRQSLVLVVVGVVLGIAAASAASRLITSLLYEVSPVDPLTYAGVAGVLLIVASVAALLPARRAARIDPMVALRAE
ncbi:MAG TPA: ABC transporter permease [Opitutaceae bacterium]|nr:ABC transporter permease [Opitutaceae bacterium]